MITNPPVLIGRTFFLRRISNPPGRLAEDFLLTPGGGLSSVRRSAAIILYILYLQYSDKKQSSQGCGPQPCELLIVFCKLGI